MARPARRWRRHRSHPRPPPPADPGAGRAGSHGAVAGERRAQDAAARVLSGLTAPRPRPRAPGSRSRRLGGRLRLVAELLGHQADAAAHAKLPHRAADHFGQGARGEGIRSPGSSAGTRLRGGPRPWPPGPGYRRVRVTHSATHLSLRPARRTRAIVPKRGLARTRWRVSDCPGPMTLAADPGVVHIRGVFGRNVSRRTSMTGTSVYVGDARGYPQGELFFILGEPGQLCRRWFTARPG